MMQWEKKGIIFNPAGKVSWAANTALQPTPLLLNNDVIRIYAGFRDDAGVSRIGWVDVESNDPSKIISYSKSPVLDVGLPGTFDDNGVVPSAVIKHEGKIFLYYAGYQLVKNVRFLVLCGLAISTDNGNFFKRIKNTPVLERTDDEFLFRVIHSVIWENGKCKVWYGGGNHFVQSDSKTLPVYDIRYMESSDGINFPESGKVVVETGEGEYRVGRPYVIKKNVKYLMFFGASTPSIPYRLTYAESENGINWTRKDDSFKLDYNENDFDSNMSAYPAVVEVGNKTYMFYNGNDYGKEGFGLAQLIS